MACNLKHPNPGRSLIRSNNDMVMMENYLKETYNSPVWPPTRTEFDKQMRAKWGPTVEGYNNQVSLESVGIGTDTVRRTNFDINMQKEWCTTCKKSVENYKAWVGPRTNFDVSLQKKWCPKCNGGMSMEEYRDYYKSLEDVNNPYSYMIKNQNSC